MKCFSLFDKRQTLNCFTQVKHIKYEYLMTITELYKYNIDPDSDSTKPINISKQILSPVLHLQRLSVAFTPAAPFSNVTYYQFTR